MNLNKTKLLVRSNEIERSEREKKNVYCLHEINIYNFYPFDEFFYCIFNFLGFSIFRISVVHLTHVRIEVCQATPLTCPL